MKRWSQDVRHVDDDAVTDHYSSNHFSSFSSFSDEIATSCIISQLNNNFASFLIVENLNSLLCHASPSSVVWVYSDMEYSLLLTWNILYFWHGIFFTFDTEYSLLLTLNILYFESIFDIDSLVNNSTLVLEWDYDIWLSLLYFVVALHLFGIIKDAYYYASQSEFEYQWLIYIQLIRQAFSEERTPSTILSSQNPKLYSVIFTLSLN